MYTRLAACGLAIAGALGLATPSWASPPTQATGTGFTIVFNLTPIRAAGGNTTYSLTQTTQYVGDLSGIATTVSTVTFHPDGMFTSQGTQTCSGCTIGGRTGDYVSNVVARGTFSQVSVSFAFLQGSGGLAGLHGQGTASGSALGVDYSFGYHFEP